MATKIPSYSYSGNHSSELKDGYWYIYLKSSGTLKFTYGKKSVAACIVGGGAGGEAYTSTRSYGGHGGGGGEVVNKTGINITANKNYSVTVGSGGDVGAWSADGGWHTEGGDGKLSSAFDYTASGGVCGGGNCGYSVKNGAATGGGNGTYAFGDTEMKRYGAGGGGGGTMENHTPGNGGTYGGGKGGYGAGSSNGDAAAAGVANSGSGGGGAGENNYETGAGGGRAGKGGSGIVILRGTEDDFLSVFFNGTQLSEMYMNGAKVETFTYAGTKIF